jgi:multidrug efflux pump subunit AcrA (membrane-fusion protein)
MTRKLAWWAVPVVIAASALALPVGDAIAQQSSADRAVSVTPTRRVCFSDMLQVTGVIVPRNEVLVRPDREGLKISQVLVEPGDTVVGGQVLARLIAPEGQPAGQGIAVQAPAGGIVISAAAVIGAPASARGEPLFRIAARGELELLAAAPAQNLASLAAKQSAKIDVVGIGELQGEVRAISTAINPVTQSGQVRLILGGDPRLRVGTFGRARIEIAQRCNTAVPLSAVLYRSGGTLVQVVRDGRIETRNVSVGLLAAGQAEIREGLNEGEMVVARAGVFVREGDRVRAVPVDEPTVRP